MLRMLWLVCAAALLWPLDVQGQPASPVTTENYVALLGDNIQLLCILGKQGARAMWTYEHTDLRDRSSTEYDENFPDVLYLTINNVQQRDAGDFTCEGDHGKSTTRLDVIEPSPPRVVRLKSTVPKQVTVSWAAPMVNTGDVKGYAIFVTKIEEPRSTTKYDVNKVSPNHKERFEVDDLTPGATYEFKLGSKYIVGAIGQPDTEIKLGPLSEGVSITLKGRETNPNKVKPGQFKAESLGATEDKDSNIVVSWKVPLAPSSDALLGYTVTYQLQTRLARKRPPVEVAVTTPVKVTQDESIWQAVLTNLKPGALYNILVKPNLLSGIGPPTGPITLRVKNTNAKKKLVKPWHLIGKDLKVTSGEGPSALVTWRLQLARRPDTLLGYQVIYKEKSRKPSKKAWLIVNVTTPVNEGSEGSSWRAVLTDLKPGVTYVVSIKPMIESGFGRLSKPVTFRVKGPNDSKVRPEKLRAQNLKATQDEGSGIVVTWRLPLAPTPDILLGYKVTYGIDLLKLRSAPKHELRVAAPVEESNRGSSWRAVLEEVKQGVRYNIVVRPILKTGFGPPAAPISINTKGLGPQLALRATALGSDTVLVTYEVLGRSTVSNLRISFINEDASAEWVNLKDFKEYTVVTGLIPKSTYFFQAQAELGSSLKRTFTYVKTPTSDVHSAVNVSVTSPDTQSILVQWQHETSQEVKGYKVTVEEKQPDDFYRIHSESFADDHLKATDVTGLEEGLQYRVKVTPYDLQGLGESTETVPFRITADGIDESLTELVPPEFDPSLPETLKMYRGDSLELPCIARGVPEPQVQWYVEGLPAGVPGAGRSDLMIDELEESVGVMCRAENDADFRTTNVTVVVVDKPNDELQTPIEFSTHLPDMHPVVPGGNITQICSATGSPKPQVRWYKEGDLVAEAAQNEFSAVFEESDITGNFTLKCVASNAFQLISFDVQVFPQEPELIAVEAFAVRVSDSQVLVRWMVTRGDLYTLSGFTAILYDRTGSQLRQDTLDKTTRSLLLDDIDPDSRYALTLIILTSDGGVHQHNLDIISETTSPSTPDTETKLHLDATEIREDQARVDIRITGQKADRVGSYRVRVNHVTPHGPHHNIQVHSVQPENASLTLGGLKPHRPYEVVVDAIPKNSQTPMVSERIAFRTSTPGRSGSPVLSDLTSEEFGITKKETSRCPESPSPVASSMASFTTTVSVGETDVSTEPEVEGTSSSTAPASETTPIQTTSAIDVTTESPEADSYTVTLRIHNLSPFSLQVGWLVEKGDLKKIHHFIINVSSGRGQKLYNSKLGIRNRSIGITQLRPGTDYVITVQAKDVADNLLGETRELVTTPPAGTKSDLAEPQLYLEVNEIRATQARLMWSVQGAEGISISGFRLLIQDRGPKGAKLLKHSISRKSKTMFLQRLPPNWKFFVTLDAVGQDNQIVLRSTLTFQTSSSKAFGVPVNGTSTFQLAQPTSTTVDPKLT